MASAMDVAQLFLAAAPQEDYLTNLKLQKLIAYAQAVSLAYSGKELFAEELEAWTHGPVVPSVYAAFPQKAATPIPPLVSWENAVMPFDEDEQYVIQMVWTTYGRFTAWALRDQSHWDFPGRFGTKEIIPKQAIKEAFKNNLLVKRMRRADAMADASHVLDI